MAKSAVVWKFPFAVSDEFVLEMPRNAKILSVQVQNERPCLWAQVDPVLAKERRSFLVIGTGHPFYTDKLSFVGTFQLLDGSFVGHLYEVING